MRMVVEIFSWACLLVGSCAAVTGGLGLLRFPDFFSRLHPAGVTDTMGAGFILLGLMIHAGFSLISVKLFFILSFLLFTSPTATHALAKAATHGRLKPLVGQSHT